MTADKANNTNPSGFERFLNRLLQTLFPAWYARQAAKEIPLQPLGVLNPNSFLCHRWMSLPAIIAALSESLQSHNDWKHLHTLLSQLLSEQEQQGAVALLALNGLEQSDHEEEWPTLQSWAEHSSGNVRCESDADFQRQLRAAFSDDNQPHRVVYREWDGRYYWINPTESAAFAAAFRYARQQQCDASIQATINIERVNQPVLERIRSDYWLLLLKRDSAYPMFDLISRAGLPAVMAEFEWRRSDLAFLIGQRNNTRLSQIMRNLLDHHSDQQILEFGRWLSQQHYPYPDL